MADNPQTPGQPGRLGQPQQGPQIQRGVPGAPPPPGPPPNEAEIIRQQQAEVQRQIAESQRIARERAAQIQGQGEPSIPSPVPGMTAEQVLAGHPPMNPQSQAQLQQGGPALSQYAPQKTAPKPVVNWQPVRGGNSVDIELTDCILHGVPESIGAEYNAESRVIAALLSEILVLRDLAGQGGGMSREAESFLMELGQRVRQLEGALFEQRQAMQQRARSVKEQIQMFSEQGMSPEEIVKALKQQADNAATLASTAPSPKSED